MGWIHYLGTNSRDKRTRHFRDPSRPARLFVEDVRKELTTPHLLTAHQKTPRQSGFSFSVAPA